jgi:hypothetical protein
VQISAINGAVPQPGDFSLLTLYAASTARALLDNLPSSRSVKGPSRTLSRAEVEQWLDKLCDQEGESHLTRIRDEARGHVFRYLVSERLNRAIFVTHTDQWPMPSCLTTAQLK